MIIAVDTGGTKTLVARFSSKGTLEEMVKFPTPLPIEEYLDMITEAIEKIARGEPIDMISLGIPGIIKNDIVMWCGNLPWRNVDVKSPLKKHFKDTRILIENDANLGGLAEAHSLSPVPVSCLYVTISTGIGTGIITNGQIDPGTRLSEGGQVLIEFEGKLQTWEHFASGQAIRQAFGLYAREIKSKKVWNAIADRISRGFLTLIPLLQPEYVIIGGSIGSHFHHYSAVLTELLEERLPPYIPYPKFVAAKHPEEAVIYGCYLYAINQKTS